jgi:N-acetylmuramoyl-L-alanine amidase
MNSFDRFFIFILFLLVAVPSVVFLVEKDVFNISGVETQNQTANVGGVVNVDDLKNRYESFSNGKKDDFNRIKVLIVPGHDDKHFGAEFNGVKEVELNRELSKYLYDFLLKDKNFRVFLAADENGYNERIKKYLEEEKHEIEEFQNEKKSETQELIERGEIEIQQYVAHNSAPEEVVDVLYGINRYANEENFDVVLHVHFNDYSRKNKKNAGEHSGISIYVPASQFLNGGPSKQMAQSIFDRLTKVFHPSTHPVERAGVIQDSELIAVGAFNSVDSIAILMEYGYIYEPQFMSNALRPYALKELAYQTYFGMKNFFEKDFAESGKQTTLLPYYWSRDFTGKEKNDLDVFVLQTFLRIHEMYPPDKNYKDCPLNGSFGNCTANALKNFQEKYNLNKTGKFDYETRKFLQDLI